MKTPACFLLVSALFSAASRADDFPPETIARVRETAVMVFANQRIKGGGVVVHSDGAVLTACHLVDTPNPRLEVEYPGGGRTPVRVAAVDVQADLMLLEPVGAVSNRTAAVLAPADPPEGRELVCVGPALWEATVSTYGRVASPGPRYREFGKLAYCSRFRLYHAMTPQLFSGAPWHTRDGGLAGIQSGYLNNLGGTGMSGLAMVGCLDDMKRLVETRRDAATPDLGGIVFELWSAAGEHIAGFPDGSEGAFVTKRPGEGALARAGIPVLALIQQVNDRPVRNRIEFFDALRVAGCGTEIRVRYRVMKSEEIKEATLRFGSLEEAWRKRMLSPAEAASKE